MTTHERSTALSSDAEAVQLVYQLGTGYMVSAALQVVLQLEIADRLAAGARPVSELAAETGVREDELYRVLRSLASVGVFDEQAPRRFALTPAGALLRKGPGTVRDMGIFLTSPTHFRVYAEMMHSVKTGQPAATKVLGKPVFEWLPEHPEFSALFNNAMTAFSANVAPAALKVYDFSGIDTLVDVAGGHGQLLTTVLAAYPRMKGVLFDLDHVIAGSRQIIDASGVSDRCRTETGDMFKAVPRGDAYIMKHIIHDWDDERATVILKNIRAAMTDPAKGRVILLDSVLQAGNAPDLGKLIDLEMMMMPGGRERTADEFRTLFAGAGFELTRIERTESPLSVIEARPRASH
jgi:hypothetical protein